MSVLAVAPESLVSAAADLEGNGSALDAAHVAAAIPTTGIAAAGADEVSAAVAALLAVRRPDRSALRGGARR